VRKFSVYHRDAKMVPQIVKDAAKKLFGAAPIQYFESEQYADLGQVFEIEVKTAAGEEEAAFKPDGTLVYREKALTQANLPGQLLKVAQGLVPNGKMVEAEHKKGPAIDEFAIKFDVNGVSHYVRLKADGTVINHAKRIPASVEVLLPR
jgi:glyoxylate carboligase